MGWIGSLSEDLLEYILMQLSPYSDLKEARLVCRRWERVGSGAWLRHSTLLHRCSALAWERLSPPPSPKIGTAAAAERCSHAAVYFPQQAAVFVFGGCTNAYTTFNDLWRLDLGRREWERVIPQGSSSPSPKACASLLRYEDRLVLFGGWSKSSPNPIHQTSIFFNELHFYYPRERRWRAVEAGAPHLAGHSVSIAGQRMIVFGGSHGSQSSNQIWAFDFAKEEWSEVKVRPDSPRPLPRYGQSQTLLDAEHILIVGGCGGPNLIFNDAWLLRMRADEPWEWRELRVANPSEGAPQLWSHPCARVGQRLLCLSKASPSRLEAERRQQLLPPPKAPRRLLSSRSLDHGAVSQTRDDAVAKEEKSPPELQRASSIPAIIVGEIPKLVVTQESPPAAHIEVAASSLLPNLSADGAAAGPSNADAAAMPPPPNPPLLTKQQRNRAKQLQMLEKMEELMKAKQASSSSSSAERPTPFRPDSPPPKVAKPPNHASPSHSINPSTRMYIYALDLSRALSQGSVSWSFVRGLGEGPEDRILYSLVEAQGELVAFGGMRNGSAPSLGVQSPLPSNISNNTYFLRPPIPL